MSKIIIIKHFITKNELIIPAEHEFTPELKQRWTNHEPSTNSKIISLLKNINNLEKKYILDAGSHVGDTLLMISAYIISKNITNIKVIGIEPDENKINFIKTIIKLNNITNIELHCNAISDVKGCYSINRSNKNSGAWSVYNDDNSNQYYVSIDEICNGKNMYLIHLDIEGYELKALNSGINIMKIVDHIILEHYHIKDGLLHFNNFFPENKFECQKLGGDVYFKNINIIY
jgi:FkbM family methyltransferase